MSDNINNVIKENKKKIDTKEEFEQIAKDSQLTEEEQEAIYGASADASMKVSFFN